MSRNFFATCSKTNAAGPLRQARGVDRGEHPGERTSFSLPQAHHRNMKTTNMLERFNEEIKRRTRVVQIFPNDARCLRLIRALAVERHETWQEDNRSINMTQLKEINRARLKAAARGSGSNRGIDRQPLSATLARRIRPSSDGGSGGMASRDRHDAFAERDAHNSHG